MPGADDSTVEREYQRGLDLARRGEYFEAHEAFELAWRACGAAERDFFQGLVHVVVTEYQRGRGRPVAEARQREKAIRRLTPFAPAHRGLDVLLVLRALERSEPDLGQQLIQAVSEPGVAVEKEEQAKDE
jgi:predicted metal-dependent hydrolase